MENIVFLQNCSPETKEEFMCLGRVETFAKGQTVLRAREKSPDIYFILEGKVQIYNLTSCGKKKILFILGKDNIANDSVFAGFSAVFCEAMERCAFFVIPRKDMAELMRRDFALVSAVMEYQEKKIWRLEHQLKNSFGSIYLERKLASKLWRLARDFGIETDRGTLIDLELSITFIADMLGVSRENASRACKKLAELEIIAVDKKQVYVLDRDRAAYYFQHGELPE